MYFIYNVYSLSCQLCNIIIDILLFSCFSIVIFIFFMIYYGNIYFCCRIKFCLVLSKDHKATAQHVRPAAKFIRARLGISPSESAPKEAVILSRRHNRLIVNEAELSFELAANVGVRVRTLSMEDVPIEEIIKRLSSAVVVVGMHGSLLALAMFLPPGSILVELFPYAINPLHYTPYRTLASLPGMDITYR